MFFKKKEVKPGLPDLPPMANDGFKLSSVRDEKKGILEVRPDKIEEEGTHLGALSVNNEDDSSDEKHNLPSFPDSAMKKGFSQSAIKEAINDYKDDKEDELPILPESKNVKFRMVETEDHHDFKAVDSGKWYSPSSMPIEPPEEHVIKKEIKPSVSRTVEIKDKDKDIYVKLEKYRNARKSLGDIESRLLEIDDLLKRIRETKLREEQELSAWEGEIISLKGKLKEVTENIFEKVA